MVIVQTHGSFEVTANLKTKEETHFLQAHFPTWLQPAIRHLSLSYSPWVLSLTVCSPQAFQKKTVVEYNLTSICEWFFPEPLIFHTLSQLLCSSRLETMGGSPFSQGSSREMLITKGPRHVLFEAEFPMSASTWHFKGILQGFNDFWWSNSDVLLTENWEIKKRNFKVLFEQESCNI